MRYHRSPPRRRHNRGARAEMPPPVPRKSRVRGTPRFASGAVANRGRSSAAQRHAITAFFFLIKGGKADIDPLVDPSPGVIIINGAGGGFSPERNERGTVHIITDPSDPASPVFIAIEPPIDITATSH